MESELEEKLQAIYNLSVEVKYIDLRKYQINVIMNSNKIEILYLWDAHYTEDENIRRICDIIDRFILKVYKKEN